MRDETKVGVGIPCSVRWGAGKGGGEAGICLGRTCQGRQNGLGAEDDDYMLQRNRVSRNQLIISYMNKSTENVMFVVAWNACSGRISVQGF